MGGIKGDDRGNDEVYFDDFGYPHLPTHRDFLTLTDAVTGIIGSGAAIKNPNGQAHLTSLLHRRIVITYPNHTTTPSAALIVWPHPSTPLLHPMTPHPHYLHL